MMKIVKMYCKKSRKKTVITQVVALLTILGLCSLSKSDETTTELYSFPKEECEKHLPMCACYDYIGVVGLECENVTDFANFTGTLTNGGTFDFNTTYEITLKGLTSLPANSMDGLIVFRLYLDDQDIADLDSKVFEGVYRLRIFHVRQSSLQKLPDFKVIRDSLRAIYFDNSHLTSLDGTGLQSLYLIETLSFINNSIRVIDADVFKGTNGVLIFDVSYNKLQSLPPTLFNNWKKLRKVVLSHNQLLHVDQLFAVTHPKIIYLDYNNLTDLDNILHPNMTSVETLLLASNPFNRVSEESFNDKVPNIRFIHLDHCEITEFDVRHYNKLKILAILDLGNNLITKISQQVVDFGSKVHLNFYGNKIKEFEAELTFTVKRLYIQDNYLEALGKTLQFTQLAEVSVARNRLQFMSQEDFRGVHGMANVELQGNKISWIDSLTFKTIQNDLHYLDLSDNLIRSLNGSVKYLSQLKALNLSQNSLESFQDGEFTGLNELAELYLQYNHLVSLGRHLQSMPVLQYLVIRNNSIQTLNPMEIPKKLQYLYMAGNPFRCDCRLLPFLQWLKTTDSSGTDISPCSSLNRTQFNISITSCPYPCSCSCAEDKDTYFMNLDCSSRNVSVLPSFLLEKPERPDEDASTLLVMQDKRNEFAQSSQFQVYDRVLGVNLEDNSLLSVDRIRLPVDLRHLRLANNKIRRIPDSLLYGFSHLTKTTLSGNPWECDCESLGFRKWLLSKSETVQDINMTLCSSTDTEYRELDGRIIYTLTDLDLCPLDIMLFVSIALVLTLLLLFVAMTLVYTKYSLNIKIWLYAHGFTIFKEKDIDEIDRHKSFDAFISYCDEDFNFVWNELLKVIEREKKDVRLCIHTRDFRGGASIHENIWNGVNESRKTICILSRDFLKSNWCLWEFNVALNQSIKDRINRILLIQVGDLPDEIDPKIKQHMTSTTYLKWGERYFWDKLFYALPEPDEACNNHYPRIGK